MQDQLTTVNSSLFTWRVENIMDVNELNHNGDLKIGPIKIQNTEFKWYYQVIVIFLN